MYMYIHPTHIADFVTASVAGLDLASKGTSVVAVILRGNKNYFYYLLCLQASKDVSATLNQPLQKWKMSLYIHPHSHVKNYPPPPFQKYLVRTDKPLRETGRIP